MPDAETKAFQLYAAIKRHEALIDDANAVAEDDDEFMAQCCIADNELYKVAEKIISGENDG
jgi:hypothetical protein